MTQAPNTPLWAKSPETGASKDILAISREKTLFQYFNGFSGTSFGRHWRRKCRNPCQIQGAHRLTQECIFRRYCQSAFPLSRNLMCAVSTTLLALIRLITRMYLLMSLMDTCTLLTRPYLPSTLRRSSQLCSWTMLTCTPLVKNLLSISQYFSLSQGGLRVFLGMETDVGAIFPAASAAYATSVHGCMWRWASTRQVSLHPSPHPYGVCNCNPAHRSMTSLRCTSLVPSNRTLL